MKELLNPTTKRLKTSSNEVFIAAKKIKKKNKQIRGNIKKVQNWIQYRSEIHQKPITKTREQKPKCYLV